MAARKSACEPAGVSLTLSDAELDAVVAGLVALLRDTGLDGLYDEESADGLGDGDALPELAARLLDRIAAECLETPASAPPRARRGDGPHHGPIRRAIQGRTKLHLTYRDRRDRASARTVWPLELGEVGSGQTLAAWCEDRGDFRHFRLDRIQALGETAERFPGHRRVLLARLRLREEAQAW